MEPLSRTRETLAVMRAGAIVFFGAWLAIGLHAGAPPSADAYAANELLPWQRLFRDLDPGLQRSYRALEEGMTEAERTRSDAKQWPDVAALADDAIPPFAPDPIDKAHYAWSMSREGLVVNYRGRPAAGSVAPELLCVIQEPEPGAVDLSSQAAVQDETHHVLLDGTLLHVTFWYKPQVSAIAPDAGGVVVDRPFAEGWTQILRGTFRKKESSS